MLLLANTASLYKLMLSRKARNIFSELSLVITAFLASCIFLQFDATILDSLESSSAGSLLHSILDVLRFLPNTNWSMKNSFTFDKEFLPLIRLPIAMQFGYCSHFLHMFLKHLFRYCIISAGIYLPKVNNRNTITRCGICSKLTIKTLASL